jgi:hypothetical protein
MYLLLLFFFFPFHHTTIPRSPKSLSFLLFPTTRRAKLRKILCSCYLCLRETRVKNAYCSLSLWFTSKGKSKKITLTPLSLSLSLSLCVYVCMCVSVFNSSLISHSAFFIYIHMQHKSFISLFPSYILVIRTTFLLSSSHVLVFLL